jgi:hypothetical protein
MVITLIIAKVLRFQPVGISAKLVAVANCDLSHVQITLIIIHY